MAGDGELVLGLEGGGEAGEEGLLERVGEVRWGTWMGGKDVWVRVKRNNWACRDVGRFDNFASGMGWSVMECKGRLHALGRSILVHVLEMFVN